MSRTFKGLVAAVAATALVGSAVGIAVADTLTNNVGGSGAVVTVAPGSTTTVAIRVNPTATPAGDPAGCDASASGGDKTTITVSASNYTNLKLKGQGAATAGPVTWDASNCKQSKKFQFQVAPGTPGGTSWSITAVGSDGIAGSLYTSQANFTLRVSATAAATSLVLSPSSPSIVYGTATQTWTATLTSGGTGVAGKVINVDVGGVAHTATTNATGVATLVAPIGTTYPVDAIAYDVDASFSGDTSYASAFAAGTFTITKADQAAMAITAPTSGSFGQTLPISYSGGSGTGAVTFGASGACSISGSTSVHIDSGSGTCTITGAKAGDANYNPTTATPLSFSPGQAPQAALTITSPTSGTYNDLLTIATSGGSGTGAVSYDAGTSDACAIESGQLRITSGTGTCSITATKAADSDYSAATSAAHTVSVVKASRTLTLTGPANGTYDGSYDITYTSSAGTGAVTFDAGSSTACEISGAQVHITSGTGTCTLVGTRAADGNYAQATSAPFSVTPDKAAATISLSGLTATYDGSAHAATATTSPAGLSGVSVTYDGLSTAPTHAGSYAVVASLAHADYVATQATGTLVISPKTLTGAITADDKEYDGSTDAVVHAVALTGLVGTPDVVLQATNGSFATATAGDAKTVTATISLSGADIADYVLSSGTASTTADITKRQVTGTVTASDKAYDRTTTAVATPVGLDRDLVGDDVDLVVDSASFDGANVGAHTVTANLSLGGADAGNYELVSLTATAPASITPRQLTASITADDKAYDGNNTATAHPTLGSGVIAPDVVNVSVSSATFSDETAAEDKTVTAYLTLDNTNYALSAVSYSATADIDPLGLAGSFTAANKQYDGSTAATVVSRSLVTPIAGDDVTLTLTAAFADRNVGTGKAVSAVSPGLTGADAGNYSLGTVSGTTADITAKPLTGAITASNKVYDGNTSATAAPVALVGVVAGDVVSLSPTNAQFADQNVANGISVTADIALGGAQAGNYALSSPTASTTANITARTLTVTAPSYALHPGDAVPSLTPAITGYVSGEGDWVLTTDPTCTTTYTSSSTPGGSPFAITCSGLVAQNYTASYTDGAISLTYRWSGFYQPIDAAPNNSSGKDSSVISGTVFNKAKAGSSIPVKFSLGGDQGLAVFTTGYPKVLRVTCPSSPLTDTVEETSTATTSGLKYDAASGLYNYTWKTTTTMANTCQQLIVKTADGVPHTAFFQFTK